MSDNAGASKQKLYMYVDESGIETEGRLFIVGCVVIEGNPQPLMTLCEQLEAVSGKGARKWGKAPHPMRTDYMRRVMKESALRGWLCYAVFHNKKDFEAATIEAIIRAVRHFVSSDEYQVQVYIDGLSKTKRSVYGTWLRKSGIANRNVQGVRRDENNALIRLADAIAGFVRDGIEAKGDEVVKLYEHGKTSGALIEV